MTGPIQNPYVTLGISPNATEAEIKKAFRKLSKIHHPDKKGGSAEEFRKISEAYESLTNPKTKGRPFSNENIDPWFSFLVRTAARRHPGGSFYPSDIRIAINVPVGLAFNGGAINIDYIKNDISESGVNGIKAKASVQIPKRMANGHNIRVPGAGNAINGKNGDLIVMAEYVTSGPGFAIDRYGNIRVQVEIPLIRTLNGEEIELDLFGMPKSISLRLDKKATSARHLYTLNGDGMKPKGDLLVEVTNSFPANIGDEDREIILEILRKYATVEL